MVIHKWAPVNEEAEHNVGSHIWLEIFFLTSGSKLAVNDHLLFMAIFIDNLGGRSKQFVLYNINNRKF